MDLSQLFCRGWIEFNSSNDDLYLIEIAKNIGIIQVHPNGNVIDYLMPKKHALANQNTFSHKYGHNSFPFHTDTAFYSSPIRYVLLSSQYISTTATTFISFDKIHKSLSRIELQTLKDSIFLIKTGKKNFYSSLISNVKDQIFIRYDTNCMIPANYHAKNAIEIISEKLQNIKTNKIVWDKPKVFIFDNWKILHGREIITNDEKRTLKRIYIK